MKVLPFLTTRTLFRRAETFRPTIFSFGSGKFTDVTASLKLEFAVSGCDGAIVDLPRLNFTKYAERLGMKAEWLDQSFTEGSQTFKPTPKSLPTVEFSWSRMACFRRASFSRSSFVIVILYTTLDIDYLSSMDDVATTNNPLATYHLAEFIDVLQARVLVHDAAAVWADDLAGASISVDSA